MDSLTKVEKIEGVDWTKRIVGFYEDSDIGGYYMSSGGFLTISTSNTKALKGIFDFSFEFVPPDSKEKIKVAVIIAGEFYAVKADSVAYVAKNAG